MFEELVDVPPHLSQIRGLSTSAASASNRAVWNTLIAREHPRGLSTFVGCQVRYLFGLEHGDHVSNVLQKALTEDWSWQVLWFRKQPSLV